MTIYTYVGGNPLSKIDPFGLAGIAIGTGGGGAVVGGGEAWSGFYYSPDACDGKGQAGTYTNTARDWGLGWGLGIQGTFFWGDGIGNFQGTGQAVTYSLGPVSIGFLYADGSWAGISAGFSAGAPAGFVVSNPSITLTSQLPSVPVAPPTYQPGLPPGTWVPFGP